MRVNIIFLILGFIFAFMTGILFIIYMGYSEFEAMMLTLLYYIVFVLTINFLDLKVISR